MKKGIALLIGLVSAPVWGQTVVYSEDFQSGMPANITLLNNDGLVPDASVSEFANAWIAVVNPDNPSDTVAGSTSFFDPAGQADRWMITPAIALGAYGNWMYWDARSHDPSYPDTYLVLVSTTDTQTASFTDTLFSFAGEYPVWTSREVNLSEAGLDNQTIHLAFVNRTDDGFKLYIDDIRVEMEDPSSVNELSSIQLRVYPNPTSEVLQVSCDQGVDEVVIVDIFGKEILRSFGLSVDVRDLPTGSYFAKVKGDFGFAVSRFVKR